METLAQTPWVPYLEEDEDGNTYLPEDIPEEIKKKYQEYMREREEMAKRGWFPK